MNFDKQRTLVQRLTKKTDQQELEWKPSVRENSYQVSFDNFTLRINEAEGRSGETDYEIEILNGEATVVDAFRDTDLDANVQGTHWFVAMRDLYDLARRQANGAEQALNTILEKLDEIPF